MAEGDLDQMSKGAVAPDTEELSCLWKKLPRELQNKVLCHLPLRNLLQVQRVCKAWRYLTLDCDFITMYDAMHISERGFEARRLDTIVVGGGDVVHERATTRYVSDIMGTPFDCIDVYEAELAASGDHLAIAGFGTWSMY